ncbi:MAG: hypothetical protein R2939_12165 [Kofleriaceae bacterium]
MRLVLLAAGVWPIVFAVLWVRSYRRVPTRPLPEVPPAAVVRRGGWRAPRRRADGDRLVRAGVTAAGQTMLAVMVTLFVGALALVVVGLLR